MTKIKISKPSCAAFESARVTIRIKVDKEWSELFPAVKLLLLVLPLNVVDKTIASKLSQRAHILAHEQYIAF